MERRNDVLYNKLYDKFYKMVTEEGRQATEYKTGCTNNVCSKLLNKDRSILLQTFMDMERRYQYFLRTGKGIYY